MNVLWDEEWDELLDGVSTEGIGTMINVMTITGIRPDFIRMREIFRRLDECPNIDHVMVHTGQHYDRMLSDVFFDELKIRKPDYNLGCGAPGKEHFELSGDITTAIIKLIREKNLNPDLILFLGDTNSVVCSVGLKKEGYTLGHIEAGMRSGDRRMLEEINRTVCDHCCDLHFVYHEDYKKNLLRENIPAEGIYVVGNTIVEVVRPFLEKLLCGPTPTRDFILMDIHRPENFKDRDRMLNIIQAANDYSRYFYIPVRMVNFGRTFQSIEELGLSNFLRHIEIIPLMSYRDFLRAQYNSLFVFSDSGTAQEEAPLLGTPVIVPRDFTERPQSYGTNCSYPLYVGDDNLNYDTTIDWLKCHKIGVDSPVFQFQGNLEWLGNGRTSERILQTILHGRY